MSWSRHFRRIPNLPTLHRNGSVWFFDLIPYWHPDFMIQRVDHLGVRPALRPEIEAWFAEHDPRYVATKVGNNLRVQFTSEDAAMHFRLRFGARIAEDSQ